MANNLEGKHQRCTDFTEQKSLSFVSQDPDLRLCPRPSATAFFRSTGLLQPFGHFHQPGERWPLRNVGGQARRQVAHWGVHKDLLI